MNLQDLFPFERIKDAKELSPGYEDHASDVWHVQTEKREVIVRTSGIGNVKCATAFFKSLNLLFGIDPCNVFALEEINNRLAGLNAFPYPKILEKHRADREYAVVELLPGSVLDSFIGLSDEELRKFGRNLAKIHRHKLHYWGNPAGTFRVDMDKVNRHICQCMKEIVDEFYADDRKIVSHLPRMERALLEMAPPGYSCFVLVDMDPSQFLAVEGKITGLVDTEAYVIAPREFDFIALEYVLDGRSAERIAQGYEEVLPVPDLKPVRTVYRYLYRLIEVQGADDTDDWLSRPVLFPDRA